MIDPHGLFAIDGTSYRILADREESRSGVRRADIAGELCIGNKRYVVVRAREDFGTTTEKDIKSPVDILTRRELQIVMHVAEGKVNKQIADCLHISEWTVSTHLRRIFVKLGVDSRAAMVYRCRL